jgi:hypothetical protein
MPAHPPKGGATRLVIAVIYGPPAKCRIFVVASCDKSGLGEANDSVLAYGGVLGPKVDYVFKIPNVTYFWSPYRMQNFDARLYLLEWVRALILLTLRLCIGPVRESHESSPSLPNGYLTNAWTHSDAHLVDINFPSSYPRSNRKRIWRNRAPKHSTENERTRSSFCAILYGE